ncbi:MAG TPA: nucleoside triphosphate pyrophosphohydrolase, partial [Candidatus Thermoplasmatota archaeon]|nr:nucleoside triphosphate pyrophosphohydrolase [Candidatus Thermoplasmatota archaeon]
MAHVLVAGSRFSKSIAHLTDGALAGLRAAGHEATDALAAPDLAAAVEAADVALAIVDGPVPDEAALTMGLARGAGIPTVLVCTEATPLAAVAERVAEAAVPYVVPTAVRMACEAAVRTGHLVRDQVPRLVREAGHSLSFREATDAGERASLLKRKVLEHARALERAGAADEKEEATDLLEAFEALIRTRAWSREELRLLKQAKLRRRGGFERCFVVAGPTPTAVEDARAD